MGMHRRSETLLTAVMVASVVESAVLGSQVSQGELARKALSEDARERRAAVEAVLAMGSKTANQELRDALITALEREGSAHVRREEAGHAGQPLPPLEDPELVGLLAQAVAVFADPLAIPALTRALGTGFVVVNALSNFGEQAAPAVLATVTSQASIHPAVDHGLIVLRMMVEGADQRPLSAEIREKIRLAAQQRLTGKQYFTTLWWAIDLGVVLNHPTLRALVQSLALDRNEVVARGVEDPRDIAATQKRAGDRLRGVPPLPRPRPIGAGPPDQL